MRTTIEVFSIQIKSKTDGLFDFSSEPDLFEIISNEERGLVHHIDISGTGDVPTLQRTVRIPANEISDEGETLKYYHRNINSRYICGIIETGAYGKENEIANKDTPKNVSYTVGKEQAIIKPFFYFLKIPRHGTKALLILERTDNEGIYPLMNLLLKNFLDRTFGVEKLFKIEKNNIVLGDYIEDLQSGRYRSVTLTANQQATDCADRYFGNLESTDFTMELVLKFKNHLGEDKQEHIRKLVNSGNTLFDNTELNTIFDNSKRKVVTTVGTGRQARTRTYYLSSEQRDLIRPYYDIDVESNDKNFSDYISIKSIVKRFVDENSEFSVFN